MTGTKQLQDAYTSVGIFAVAASLLSSTRLQRGQSANCKAICGRSGHGSGEEVGTCGEGLHSSSTKFEECYTVRLYVISKYNIQVAFAVRHFIPEDLVGVAEYIGSALDTYLPQPYAAEMRGQHA